MNKYMYDCYDKERKSLGIFFEAGTKELLEHHPNVKYIKGIDAVTRCPVWHETGKHIKAFCGMNKKEYSAL